MKYEVKIKNFQRHVLFPKITPLRPNIKDVKMPKKKIERREERVEGKREFLWGKRERRGLTGGLTQSNNLCSS